MSSSPIPETYEQWRHCITVDCDIKLTPTFITQRLSIWRNPKAEETERFSSLYGEAYLREVIGWFERAERELS